MKQAGRNQTVVLILFFLSGASGLIYEVIWQGMLNLAFGNTAFATATVVASFMGGMALGSFILGRIADRYKKPLVVFAMLEIGIGIFALLFPIILSGVSDIQISIFQRFPTTFYASSLIKFVLCFFVLLVPSFLMGGTLPVISRFFVTTPGKLGGGVGRLYGINTLGGVVGAFSAIFFLITTIGVRQITYIAAGLNVLVALSAWVLSRYSVHDSHTKQTSDAKRQESPKQRVYPDSIRRMVLIVYSLSGLCALAYEILWTRILAFFLGNSTHAFAVILTTYLLGLALGSLLFSRFLDRIKRLLIAFAFVEVLIGLFALLSLWEFTILGRVLDNFFVILGGGWGALMATRYIGSFLVMLVPTLLLGIAFPLVNKIYTSDINRLGHGIGNIYSANTLGSIAGSFMAGFILIPAIGITKSMMLIASINVILGTVVAFSTIFTGYKAKWPALAAAAVLVGVVTAAIIVPSTRFQTLYRGQELMSYEEGSSSTVAVIKNEKGYKLLVVNGVYEVATDYTILRTFRILGHLPLLIHPDPQKALVISFGAGVTSGAVARHDLEQIDAVEISPEVIDANKYFIEESQDVLSDPRVNLIIDDGRNYLLRTTNHYDVITADATHPTGSDSWVLYTKEFYELCRGRLNPDGIMAQWLPVHALAPVDYKTIVKTFQTIFPDTTIWFTNDYTVLLGTTKELKIDFTRFSQRLQEKRIMEDLVDYNLDDPYDFLGSFIMGKESIIEYTKNHKINTDNHPYVQSAERRSRADTNPSNMFALAESAESVFPLLVNVGADAAAVEATVQRYSDVMRHIIRARGFYYMGSIQQQIGEYEEALSISPEDDNTKYLLELARGILKE
jgi:spermidine synthase